MDKIRIKGGVPLHGKVMISGAKNAALPLMAASLLTEEPLTLYNLPHLADIVTMANLLVHHGVKLSVDGTQEASKRRGKTIILDGSHIPEKTAPYDIVRKMRASVLVLGPLLARFGEAYVSLPGGCAIGTRPLDLHLNALQQLGAEIELHDGYIHAKAPENGLVGGSISFDKVSVGATENALMAASLAEGTTVMMNAAREPEVADLAHCLVAMGAKITGIGTSRIEVTGVPKLHGAEYSVIPDRIEAGTYAVAAAMTGGSLELCGIKTPMIQSVLEKLQQAGAVVKETLEGVLVSHESGHIKAIDITTQPFPGFPTDMQAQFMALASVAEGTSTISENIFENRFMHVSEMNRMGADIVIKGNNALVRGVDTLSGAQVMATDLRASVSLILAGLAAKGETVINRVYHLDRGYECIEEKLGACNAQIERIRG